MDSAFTTPVAFFVFNRPEVTRRVFNVIRRIKPKVLLLIADGPRKDNVNDVVLCEQVLEIVESVNWDCAIYRNYSLSNLGCKRRVSSGLDWVFTMVDRAIVLEDDCLPDDSFFYFCSEILTRYQYEDSVMHVSGFNRLSGSLTYDNSYIFSRFGSIWGWATWRRAWKYYDVDMAEWKRVKENKDFAQLGRSESEISWRIKLFDKVYDSQIDTWDYQWVFARIMRKGISVIPSVNLIANIGFGSDATHTHDANDARSLVTKTNIAFPMSHPDKIVLSDSYDKMYLISAIG